MPGTVRVLTGEQIPVGDRDGLLNRRKADEWLLVTFSSDDDVLKRMRRRQMHVSLIEMLCSNGKVIREIMSAPILSGPADAQLLGSQVGAQTTKRFPFRAYFSASAPRRTSPSLNVPGEWDGYDLRHETQDLCIKVHGGNMVMMEAVSGIAVFPNSVVQGAFEDTPPTRPNANP